MAVEDLTDDYRESERRVTATTEAEATRRPSPSKKGRVRAIALGVLAVGALGVVGWYAHHAGLEDTDDAQVGRGRRLRVPARIGGSVQKVLFAENQHVKAGDVLVELDPAQPKARLEEAEAQLAADKAAADAADSDVSIIRTTATGQKGAARGDAARLLAGGRPRRGPRSRRRTRRSGKRRWPAIRRRRTSTA